MLSKFYWGHIRKSIVAFGNVFNSIYIDRFNEDGSVAHTLKVPLAYAPAQKYLARIKQMPQGDGSEKIQVNLPRMSFEMVNIQYDPLRRTSPIHQNRKVLENGSVIKQYSAVPYNINVNLYIYSRNQDDGLQIVEQILPYFNPDYNLTANTMPELDIKQDLPIILESLSVDDDYEGMFEDRRMVIWTLSFMMKLNFYGPIEKGGGVIKKAIVSTYNQPDMTEILTRTTVAVDPLTASENDDYTIIEQFEEF